MSQLNSNKLKKNRTSFQPGHTARNKGTRRMITYTCLVCGIEVTKRYRKGLKHSYCSTSCWARSPECRKLSDDAIRPVGEKHHLWKGDQVNYFSLHAWVQRKLGTPQECENCEGKMGSTRYEWANISGEYKRDLSDWARLCKRCHALYDGIGNHTIERSMKYAQ